MSLRYWPAPRAVPDPEPVELTEKDYLLAILEDAWTALSVVRVAMNGTVEPVGDPIRRIIAVTQDRLAAIKKAERDAISLNTEADELADG